jgi:hypothetical protein
LGARHNNFENIKFKKQVIQPADGWMKVRKPDVRNNFFRVEAIVNFDNAIILAFEGQMKLCEKKLASNKADRCSFSFLRGLEGSSYKYQFE